jgi:hypothetical protein
MASVDTLTTCPMYALCGLLCLGLAAAKCYWGSDTPPPYGRSSYGLGKSVIPWCDLWAYLHDLPHLHSSLEVINIVSRRRPYDKLQRVRTLLLAHSSLALAADGHTTR